MDVFVAPFPTVLEDRSLFAGRWPQQTMMNASSLLPRLVIYGAPAESKLQLKKPLCSVRADKIRCNDIEIIGSLRHRARHIHEHIRA